MTIPLFFQSILGASIVFIAIVLAAALKKMAQKEIEASVPELSRHLLSRAIERLPAECRKDDEEEWRGELGDAIDKRPLWALAEVASLYWAAGRIAAELLPAPAPAKAGADTGQSGGWRDGVASRIPRSVRGVAALWERLRSALLRGLKGVTRAAAVRIDPASRTRSANARSTRLLQQSFVVAVVTIFLGAFALGGFTTTVGVLVTLAGVLMSLIYGRRF